LVVNEKEAKTLKRQRHGTLPTSLIKRTDISDLISSNFVCTPNSKYSRSLNFRNRTKNLISTIQIINEETLNSNINNNNNNNDINNNDCYLNDKRKKNNEADSDSSLSNVPNETNTNEKELKTLNNSDKLFLFEQEIKQLKECIHFLEAENEMLNQQIEKQNLNHLYNSEIEKLLANN
jgi:hypothetical protein